MSTRLEDLLHETLTAYGAAAPDDSTLLRDVRSRATRRRRRRLGWVAVGGTAVAVGAIVLALVTLLPSGSSGPTSSKVRIAGPSATSYPLPSDGWKPGDSSLDALTGGPFHAARISGQVCAWLGAQFRPMLWPAGYAVRLNPATLIAPDGTVVAREGQNLRAGGGRSNAKPGTPCAQPGQDTWFVSGAPSLDIGRVHGHLSAVGGPAPGSRKPLSGEVTATGPQVTRTVQVGPDGNFSLTLPPGNYTLTGHGPDYGGGRAVCRTADSTVHVRTSRAVTADVVCQEN
jgi:hypothetical protein